MGNNFLFIFKELALGIDKKEKLLSAFLLFSNKKKINRGYTDKKSNIIGNSALFYTKNLINKNIDGYYR